MMKLPEELQFIANDHMVQKTTQARMDGKICVLTGATWGLGTRLRDLPGVGPPWFSFAEIMKRLQVRNELENEYGVTEKITAGGFFQATSEGRAAGILELYRIDVLINNAGLHNTKRILTENEIEIVFHVNHLASFLFTRLLLPRIIEGSPARIIQVNSGGIASGDRILMTWTGRNGGMGSRPMGHPK